MGSATADFLEDDEYKEEVNECLSVVEIDVDVYVDESVNWLLVVHKGVAFQKFSAMLFVYHI